jgi:futalosine hydrolase
MPLQINFCKGNATKKYTNFAFMRVIISAATMGEWMDAYLKLSPVYSGERKRLKLSFHESGVGMLAAAFSLTKIALYEKPDLIVQAGIAGCFDANVKLGKTFVVREEILGNTGVEEDEKWKDIFELKLEKSSFPPFEKRRLPNQWEKEYNLLGLPAVAAITVSEITTNPTRIKQLQNKYNPTLESMEGAALHYVCRKCNIPFLQIRSVSNYVGVRDKSQWKTAEALKNLNETLVQYVEKLYRLP